MADDGKRVARERASRLREFHDCDQEWRETKDQKALRRRAQAMRKGTIDDFRRAGERLARDSWQEGEDKRQRLRKNKFTGWKVIKE